MYAIDKYYIYYTLYNPDLVGKYCTHLEEEMKNCVLLKTAILGVPLIFSLLICGCFGVAPAYLAIMAATSIGTTAAGTAIANKATEKKSEPPPATATPAAQSAPVSATSQTLASPPPATKKLIPLPAEKNFDSGATLADARNAKRVQGLKGVMFQDRDTKAWFLEDPEGITYKLRNGVFVKI